VVVKGEGREVKDGRKARIEAGRGRVGREEGKKEG